MKYKDEINGEDKLLHALRAVWRKIKTEMKCGKCGYLNEVEI
jgi:hypothetical protein